MPILILRHALTRLNHNAGNFKTDYNYIRRANFETASPSETSYKMNEWIENMNFQLKNSNQITVKNLESF